MYNHRVILHTISIILLALGSAMIFPTFCAVYYNELNCAKAFFFCAICTFAVGAFIFRFMRYSSLKVKFGESYLITLICWVVACLVCTIPYLLADVGYGIADAFFESVAGWTTTGAFVLPANTLPNSILLWKSITNWLGGMGLLLLAVSFFPVLGAQGQKMATAEMSGTSFQKLSSRTSQTALISYSIYIIMTIVEFLLLLPSEMSPMEALVNTFSSISTAGLVNMHNCLVTDLTPYSKGIIFIFTVIGSINFLMYYLICTGKIRRVFENVELRTFLGLLLGGGIICGITLYYKGVYDSLPVAIGNAFVQCASYSATSGFKVADINLWPTVTKTILMILMIIGGCGNSTCGSIKVIRFVIFIRIIKRSLYKRIHPKAVKPVMLNGSAVSSETASNVTVFILLYFSIFMFACLAFSLENKTIETTIFTTLACISNNGTGFGEIINGDFSIFSPITRVFAAILMLGGRLEFFSIIMIFSPSFWNQNRARS